MTRGRWWLIGLALAGMAVGVALLLLGRVGAQGLKLAHEPLPVDQPPKYLGSIALTRQGGERLFPQSLVVTGSQLYVGYTGIDRGDIFTFEGQRVGELAAGHPGSSPIPVGMAFDGQGRRYLADRTGGMVLVFDARGAFAYRLPSRPLPGSPSLVPIWSPGGVAVRDNAVYVSDTEDGLVKVFDIDTLEPIVSFGASYTEKRLASPAGLVVTDDGRVLVADADRGVVEVFTCDGRYAYRFHEPSNGEKLARPEAIAIDTEPTGAFAPGRVHVVDSAQGKVFVYDYFGNFLFTYGSSAGNGLSRPKGIAVAPEERLIFVADSKNQEIDIYGY